MNEKLQSEGEVTGEDQGGALHHHGLIQQVYHKGHVLSVSGVVPWLNTEEEFGADTVQELVKVREVEQLAAKET